MYRECGMWMNGSASPSQMLLAGLGFFLELGFLSPRAKLAEVTNAEVFSLVNVEG